MNIIRSLKAPVEMQTSQSVSNSEAEQNMSKTVTSKLEEVMHGISPSPENSTEFVRVSNHIHQLVNVIKGKRPDDLQSIKLYILPLDELTLTSYPPNIIVISRSITDIDAPCGAENESAIIGLLAHELSHLWFGHTQEKWKWITLSNNVESSNYKAFFFNLITSRIPIIPSVIPTSTDYLPDGAYSEWYFESAADLFALKVMTALQLDITQYLFYWEKISRNVESGICQTNENIKTIKQRVERIRAYIDNSRIKGQIMDNISLIVINTGEIKTEIPLSNYEDIKETPGEFIGLLRNINYWKCAIRQNPDWRNHFISYEMDISFPGYKQPLLWATTSIPYSINGFSSFVFEGYQLQLFNK